MTTGDIVPKSCLPTDTYVPIEEKHPVDASLLPIKPRSTSKLEHQISPLVTNISPQLQESNWLQLVYQEERQTMIVFPSAGFWGYSPGEVGEYSTTRSYSTRTMTFDNRNLEHTTRITSNESVFLYVQVVGVITP
jgi:hypothetical protein